MSDKMTVEETINGLQDMIQSKKYIEHNFDGVVNEDVCERAIELIKEDPLVVYECKVNKCVCGNEVNRYWHPKYCGFCGKKFEWRMSVE